MPVSPAPYDSGNTSSALTAGNVTTSDTQMVAASPNRKHLILHNSHATDSVYVSFGSVCTTTNASIVLTAGETYELSGYAGQVRATKAATTAVLFVTELQ